MTVECEFVSSYRAGSSPFMKKFFSILFTKFSKSCVKFSFSFIVLWFMKSLIFA